MTTSLSLGTIQKTRSGVLRFGNSTHVPHLLTLDGETISLVACGRYHSALVCRSGLVYTLGDFGEGYAPKIPALPRAVRVSRAACGDRFTCLVTSEGDLYTVEGKGEPVKAKGVPKIRAVSAGAGHFIALATDGGAWASGLNSHGQLGVGDRADRTSPILVPGVGKAIMEAACCGHRTALLSAEGDLYVAGSNAYNALGLGVVSDVETFQRLRLVSPVAAIACGGNHMVALTVEGTVWAWGQNYYGQLGVGEGIEVSCTPVPVDGLQGLFVTEISAGGEHTALMTDEGTVLMCGSGGEGELGGAKKDAYVPRKLPLPLPADLRVEQVLLVCNATLLLVEGTEVGGPTPPPREATPPPPADITDWERSIMATLECPICFRVMCAPIHQCSKGHNFCNSCRARSDTQRCCLCREPFVGTRNMALETLGETLRLPCPDCLARMPVPNLEAHALVCPLRMFCCPLSEACGWTGASGDVLPHARAKHTTGVWDRLPREFTHQFNDHARPVLLSAHGRVFVLHRRFDRSSDGFRVVAGLVGPPGEGSTAHFELRVDFIAQGEPGRLAGRMVVTGEVRPNMGDVDAMLFSEGAVSLGRKNSSAFVWRNRVTCRVQIVTKRR